MCVNFPNDAKAAQFVVDTIRSSGGNAIAVQGDVAVESDGIRLFDACETEFGEPRA